MIRDLRTILDGWEYEPGKISVRKIIGRDGREKIQTRIDMGVLQLEVEGRPDGKRPHGFESLLESYEHRLAEHIRINGSDEDFLLAPEDCRDLRHEAYIYYQRYLSQFVLEEFEAVQRDTTRSLRLIDFCERYAANPSDREALSAQRAYVIMMNCRAKVYSAMNEGRYDAALRMLNAGVRDITETCAQASEDEDGDASPRPELAVIEELRAELIGRMPPDALPRIEQDLAEALEHEDYERAAELRDRLSKARRGQVR